jgi:hypothetical protein
MQSLGGSWLVHNSPYEDYISDIRTFDQRLRHPDPKPLELGISWENCDVNIRVVAAHEGKRPDTFISTGLASDFLRKYISQQRQSAEPLRTAYIFEIINRYVAAILGNMFGLIHRFSRNINARLARHLKAIHSTARWLVLNDATFITGG